MRRGFTIIEGLVSILMGLMFAGALILAIRSWSTPTPDQPPKRFIITSQKGGFGEPDIYLVHDTVTGNEFMVFEGNHPSAVVIPKTTNSIQLEVR